MTNTILITGASTGIGRATALYFHEQGWNVVATMRSPEKETELNQLAKVLVTRLDVTEKASIEIAVKQSIEYFGGIDVVLNNAGYGAFGPLEAFSDEKIHRQWDTNVMGLMDVTRALLPHFRAKRSGVVINVSSIGGKMSFPLGSLYHGTKFAVEGISEALQYELAAFGAKVKIIEPGAIATDFAGRSFDFVNDESMEEYQALTSTLWDSFASILENASPAKLVAEVIWHAATDGSTQLRYTAGDDAKVFVDNRKTLDDASFFDGIKSQFGLS